jgi:hypothetical protein
MWAERIGVFGEPSEGELGIGEVIDELVWMDPEFDDRLFDCCAERTLRYHDGELLLEVTQLMRGLLAGRGWPRRPHRLDDDYSRFAYDRDTVPTGTFDARALILIEGEMAFRTYPGEHAFFDPDSEPARARTAAELDATAWLWSTVAALDGHPGLDGHLLMEAAASWTDGWDALRDHVARLQQP